MKWPLLLNSGGPLPHSSTSEIYATSTEPPQNTHAYSENKQARVSTHPTSPPSILRTKKTAHSTDPNIPIQPRRNHARNQTNHIPDVLPGLLRDALVREREGVLALEGVDEEAVHEVDGRDQELGADLAGGGGGGRRLEGRTGKGEQGSVWGLQRGRQVRGDVLNHMDVMYERDNRCMCGSKNIGTRGVVVAGGETDRERKGEAIISRVEYMCVPT